jgi:hypothetical protein
MGSSLGIVILAGLLQAGTNTDTATYANEATRELVALARARHAAADTTVRDYRAALRYRMSFGVGKRRWAEPPTAAVTEQDATVHWSLPNDLRVDVRGRRSASRLDGVDIASSFSRPWFVPRTLSDSIRVMGSESPSRAAPHPLGPAGEAVYRFAAGPALTIGIGNRQISIRPITIEPRPNAAAAVVGKLWVDAASGDVVRFTFRFVGTELWSNPDATTREDSSESRFANRLVSRILQLDADLEYSLQDNKYWLPYRQVLSGRVTLPLGIDLTVPFEAITTFDDYEVNTGDQVVFDAPFQDPSQPYVRESRATRDSLRRERSGEPIADSLLARDRTGYLSRGGRYQIHRPPLDSLHRYAGWSDSLQFEGSDADKARLREALSDVATMAEELEPELTGRAGGGFAWDKAADLLRYNRVQGTTFSATAKTRGPFNFSDVFGTARFGLADNRLMLLATMVRDAPSGRLTITAGRDLVDTDAFARGLNFGNSLRAILVGRDDGAYLLSHGIRITHASALGTGTELEWGVRLEDQQSVRSEARAGIPRVFGSDGYFQPNPAIREGFATGGHLKWEHSGYAGGIAVMGEGLLVKGEAAGRFTVQLRQEIGAVAARIKVGVAPGAGQVSQMGFLAGGVQTVRGYDFGIAGGNAIWSTQLDVALGGKSLKWLVFADAAQAGQLANFGDARFLSSAGVAGSLLGGIIRAELSHPITSRNGNGLRLDLVFGSPQ